MSRRKHVPDNVRRMRVYRERNRNIRAMGFKDYSDYQKSDLWKGIRALVLAAHPFCFGCGKDATQVHHSAYRKKDLEGRDLRRLFSVCASCHYRCEFRQSDHEKLHPKQATRKLMQFRASKKSQDTPALDRLFI